MTGKLFPVVEIGSLAKLPGRQAKLSGEGMSTADFSNLELVLKAEPSPQLKQLAEVFMSAASRDQIVASNSAFNLKLLELLGLDYVFDGEAHRTEMYEHVLRSVQGMRRLGRQVSFVNVEGLPNTFVPYMHSGELSVKDDLYVPEAVSIVYAANGSVKFPITGAYTLGTWSDAGEIPMKYVRQGLPRSVATKKGVEDLVLEFADGVINPMLKKLTTTGVARIQIDEPSASVYEGQEELFYETTRRSIQGVEGVELGLHLCFSRDYATIAGVGNVPQIKFITFEAANRDDANHDSYTHVVEAFENAGYSGVYTLGLFHIHTNEIPAPELIAERIIHVANLVGPERVEAAPDCGLRTRPLHVAIKQLQALVKGAELARQHY